MNNFPNLMYNNTRSISSLARSRLYLLNPLATYANCEVDKKNIFTAARAHLDKGVVYCWVNNLNKKCYVGSSINFTMRLYKYYSVKNLNENKNAISGAFLIYGYSNFSLHILEYCNKNECMTREQYYIDLLKPVYNILQGAGSSYGFKHNVNTLKLFKKRTVSAVTRNNLSKAAGERILTEKEKTKIALSRIGKNMPALIRKKVSDTAKQQWGNPVEVKDTFTNQISNYPSLTEAANVLNVSRTAVRKALEENRLLKNKWLVRRLK